MAYKTAEQNDVMKPQTRLSYPILIKDDNAKDDNVYNALIR
jgi:hypothetical protein